MTSLPDFQDVVSDVQRLEQTASTSPPQPPAALERATRKMETSATSVSENALTIARQIVFAVTLSALSVSPQIATPSTWRRREVVTNSESSPTKISPELVQQMRQMLERAAYEFFEDGMDSNFSQELLLSVIDYGNAAIDAIAEYLFSSMANADVGSETLRRLADIRDPRILATRWALLQRSLKHRSSRVRDGAVLAFASLDDHRALEFLQDAMGEEPVPELRRLIQKVIKQLGVTHGETAAQS